MQILPKSQLLGPPIVAQDGKTYYDSKSPYRRNDSFYVFLPDDPQ